MTKSILTADGQKLRFFWMEYQEVNGRGIIEMTPDEFFQLMWGNVPTMRGACYFCEKDKKLICEIVCAACVDRAFQV